MKIELIPTTAALSKIQVLPQAACASLLLVMLAATGCGKHVQQGQIFVATQGGENVKLGAVEILAFDDATISAFVKQRQAEITQQRDKLQQEVDVAQNELEKMDAPYSKAVREFHEAQERYYDQDALVRRKTGEAKQTSTKYGEMAERVLQLSNFVAQDDQQIAAIQKNAEAEAARTQDESLRKIIFRGTNQPIRTLLADKQGQQADLEALLPKYNELKQQVNKQAASLEPEQQKLQGIEAQLQEKQKAEKDAEDLHVDANRRLDDAKRVLAGFDATDILFKDLPPPAARTVSDADGRFRLELPSGGRCAVYAHAQRTVSQTEDYFWFIWATGKGDLLLNNANMFGSGSVDQVVRAAFQ